MIQDGALRLTIQPTFMAIMKTRIHFFTIDPVVIFVCNQTPHVSAVENQTMAIRQTWELFKMAALARKQFPHQTNHQDHPAPRSIKVKHFQPEVLQATGDILYSINLIGEMVNIHPGDHHPGHIITQKLEHT